MGSKGMLVGEVAKRLNVSVRTLQYYDKQKLCSPAAFTEGGRRLYCDKDIVQLHQILSMKYLGFSLAEIKNNLPKLSATAEVVELLQAQERQLCQRIDNLTKAREATRLLLKEVNLIEKVDWRKYATIVDLIKANNAEYWVIKHFDEDTLIKVTKTYDDKAAKDFMNNMERIWDGFSELIDKHIAAESDAALEKAKAMWGMVMDFCGGDNDVLQQVFKFGQNNESWQNEKWKEKWIKVQEYSGLALQKYLIQNNIEVKA